MYLNRLSISKQEKWAHINVWILGVDVWFYMMLEVSIIPPVSWQALRRRENSFTNRIFSPDTLHRWSVLHIQSENRRFGFSSWPWCWATAELIRKRCSELGRNTFLTPEHNCRLKRTPENGDIIYSHGMVF